MNLSGSTLSVVVADPRGYTPPYDYSLCNALAEKDCEVLLACTELGQVKWNLEAAFPVWNAFYEMPGASEPKDNSTRFGKAAQGLDHLLGMRRFMGMLRKRSADVIHFQWLPLPILDYLWLTRLKRKAGLVLTLHNTTLFHGVVSRWRGLGFVSALKQFDAVIVHSEFSRHRVVERGWIDESRIHIVPHGVLDYYCGLSNDRADRRSTKNLLFFGNLHPYKGVDILLRAFARLSPAVAKNVRLVIAGRPEMNVEPLRQLSRELKIEGQVNWILRPILESEVPEFFRAATAVVLPYREIDQSGVLMTAIAFGKAVLATHVGGIPEIIRDGVHGYLVAPGDVQGLALAADRLLSSGERRKSMEAAVRDLRNGKLAWPNIASRTLEIYRHVVEQRSQTELRQPIPALAEAERRL
jgi:glycosyltransferase involved in cell wall biosynthesis